MKYIAILLYFIATFAYGQITLPIPMCINRDALAVQDPVRPLGLPPPAPNPSLIAAKTTTTLVSCGTPMLEANPIGGAVAYFCKAPKVVEPTLYLYAVRWRDVTTAMLEDFALLSTPGDNLNRIQEMAKKYQTNNVWDMCDVWGPMRERINVKYAALTPPIIWTVSKYSTQITRPAYAINDGIRSSVSASRAPVVNESGQPTVCDCKLPLVEGTTTYCPFSANKSLVAVCKVQQ